MMENDKTEMMTTDVLKLQLYNVQQEMQQLQVDNKTL